MHIGTIVQAKLKEEGKTVVWLAKELSCHRSNVYNLFSKYSIDTHMLERLSMILNFDFFKLYEEEIEEKLNKKPEELY